MDDARYDEPGRYSDAESDGSELLDEDPSALFSADLLREDDDPAAAAAAGLFSEQLRLLPFLVKAADADTADLEVYEHSLPGGAPVRIAQFPQGVGCAAQAGRPAWGWRVWDAARAVARTLEADARWLAAKPVVIELGAGAGLAALAAARLGASAVVATDLPRALRLAAHNVALNGGQRADGGSAQAAAAGGVAVCCPGGHALEGSIAPHEDYVCNCCGLDDPMGGGIDEGEPVHCCRACDFDICGECHDAAARADWGVLPGWFRLQCEGELAEPAEWVLPDGAASLALQPWDLLAAGGVEAGAALAAAAAVRLGERTGAASTLVLCADVSCSAALVAPLVGALVALRRLLPPGGVVLLAHEEREAAVDAALRAALGGAALVAEAVPLPAGEELEGAARLQLMRIEL